ncbi:MAG: ArnT family glycosyltransferase [Roseiflexaceae bacterium]
MNVPSPASSFRRLWFIFVAILIASGSGHFYASDEEKMFATTLRMWQAIQHIIDPSITIEQPILSVYGPMQSILALFTLPIGSLLATFGPVEMQAWLLRLPSTWINAVVVASTAVTLGWLSMRHYHSRTVGIAIAVTYAFATPAWVYARSFFSEPTAAFFLLVACLPLFFDQAESRPRRTLYILAGLATLGALLSKIAVAPAVAVIGISVVIMSVRQRDWHKLIAWGSGAGMAAVIFLTYNLLARGSLLSSGYNRSQTGLEIRWDYIITGLHGQFFSSGKSIFLYAPLLLLWPVGLWLQRHNRQLTISLIGVIAAIVLIHTNVIFWHGDGAWGPRYLMLAMPFMVWPLAAVYQALGTLSQISRRAVILPLIIATVIVQIAGLSINLNAVIIDTRNERARYYELASSPIVGHWRALWRQLSRDFGAHTQAGVTLAGWSYSEGDRERNQQFPRYASNHATITVTPRERNYPQLVATYHSCLDETNQMRITLAINGYPLQNATTCPPRQVRILLPNTTSTIALQSDGVTISGLPQHEWYPSLGAAVLSLVVYDSGTVAPIWANPTPPSQMPNTPNAMRVWASDIRSGFYDYWWYYLIAVPRSAPIMSVIALIWAIIIGLGALAWLPQRRHTKQHQTAK